MAMVLYSVLVRGARAPIHLRAVQVDDHDASMATLATVGLGLKHSRILVFAQRRIRRLCRISRAQTTAAGSASIDAEDMNDESRLALADQQCATIALAALPGRGPVAWRNPRHRIARSRSPVVGIHRDTLCSAEGYPG